MYSNGQHRVLQRQGLQMLPATASVSRTHGSLSGRIHALYLSIQLVAHPTRTVRNRTLRETWQTRTARYGWTCGFTWCSRPHDHYSGMTVTYLIVDIVEISRLVQAPIHDGENPEEFLRAIQGTINAYAVSHPFEHRHESSAYASFSIAHSHRSTGRTRAAGSARCDGKYGVTDGKWRMRVVDGRL